MITTKYITILFFTIFACVIVLASLVFFPFENCFDYPLIKYDFAYHFTNSVNSVKYTLSHLSSWGYNPHHGAGFSEGHGLSTRILIPFMVLFHAFPPHLVFNTLIWLSIIAMPISFAFAAKLFNPASNIRKITFCYISFYLFGSNIGQEFIYIGHFGFILSMNFALIAIGFFNKFSNQKSPGDLIFQSIFAGLAIWTHPLAVAILTPFYLWIFIRVRFKWREIMSFLFAFIAMTITPNLFWLPGFIKYLSANHTWGSMDQYLQTDNFAVVSHILKEPALLIMIVAMIMGHTLKIRHQQKNIVNIIFAMIITIIISFFGSQLYFNDFQPLRFLIPCVMLGIILLSSFKNNLFHLIIIILLIPITSFRLFNANHYVIQGCGFPEKEGIEMLSFIREHIGPYNKRIHIQSSKATPYYNIRIASIIPYYTSIPIVALPMPYPVEFSSFLDDYLWGKKLENLSRQEFHLYTDLYNIGFFITYSKKAKTYFKTTIKADEIFTNTIVSIFKIDNKKSNYCYKCKARIMLKDNALFIDNITEPEITLKYHYKSFITSNTPNIILKESMLKDDPVPFITFKTQGLKSVVLNLNP